MLARSPRRRTQPELDESKGQVWAPHRPARLKGNGMRSIASDPYYSLSGVGPKANLVEDRLGTQESEAE